MAIVSRLPLPCSEATIKGGGVGEGRGGEGVGPGLPVYLISGIATVSGVYPIFLFHRASTEMVDSFLVLRYSLRVALFTIPLVDSCPPLYATSDWPSLPSRTSESQMRNTSESRPLYGRVPGTLYGCVPGPLYGRVPGPLYGRVPRVQTTVWACPWTTVWACPYCV